MKTAVATWDWKDMDGAVEALQEALEKIGVRMTPLPALDGTDTYGFLFSDEAPTLKDLTIAEEENGMRE